MKFTLSSVPSTSRWHLGTGLSSDILTVWLKGPLLHRPFAPHFQCLSPHNPGPGLCTLATMSVAPATVAWTVSDYGAWETQALSHLFLVPVAFLSCACLGNPPAVIPESIFPFTSSSSSWQSYQQVLPAASACS